MLRSHDYQLSSHLRAEEKRAAKFSTKGAKRAAKFSTKGAKRGGQPPQGSKPGEGKRSRADESETGLREIEASGLEEYFFCLAFLTG